MSDDVMCAWSTLWDGVIDWQWTPGWGNLFTVMVAVAAIAVSAWYNRRTLRGANEKFVQGRIDARNDKLRAELAAYLSDLDECRLQSRKLGKFMRELIDAPYQLSQAEAQPWQQNAQLVAEKFEQYREQSEAAYLETVWDVYRRLAVRDFTLMMLTSDKGILEPTHEIYKLIEEDRRDFESLIAAREKMSPSDPRMERGRTLPERHLSRQSDIYDQMIKLMDHCVTEFPVNKD
ncbi:hypothetical protein KXD96_22805 [Mycobacterium sp. SMC-2]|uniref:hypothetical protein n=1 Tax=Mycobacterium sp. SMC-2 TaxID=2857058 RepID=UPI0021B3BEAE|nr:hypothetical protein [Mycobacterium sp. SMC-2]UXA05707.1 hypothetical protein KXD96_22805 [Mycobacterium sp. SMC-2]